VECQRPASSPSSEPGAAAVLGHRLGTVTGVDAEADLQKAIAIMRAIGPTTTRQFRPPDKAR